MGRPHRLRLQVSTLHANGPSTLSEIDLTRQAEGARRGLLLAFLVVSARVGSGNACVSRSHQDVDRGSAGVGSGKHLAVSLADCRRAAHPGASVRHRSLGGSRARATGQESKLPKTALRRRSIVKKALTKPEQFEQSAANIRSARLLISRVSGPNGRDHMTGAPHERPSCCEV
jgi:hypothetical protein